MNMNDLSKAARDHADRLRGDIELASSREEHVRLTARLNEAEQLAAELYQLAISEEASTV